MDLLTILKRNAMYLLCFAVIIECTSTDWLNRSIRSARSERNRRTHKNVNSNEIGTNTEYLHSFKADRASTDCCFNGGICIMNTFCHCLEGYHGRYCEHKTRDRSCGKIQHGTWMARGCFLCHCFDGNMRCKTTKIPNCDYIPYVQGVETSPDYQVDVDKKFEDYDRFYDISDNEVTNQLASCSSLPVSSNLRGIIALLIVGLVVGKYGS